MDIDSLKDIATEISAKLHLTHPEYFERHCIACIGYFGANKPHFVIRSTTSIITHAIENDSKYGKKFLKWVDEYIKHHYPDINIPIMYSRLFFYLNYKI